VTLFLALLLAIPAAGEKPEPHIQAAAAAYRDGQTASTERNWQRAEKLFLQAIDIEPTYTQVYSSLIDLYMSTERQVEAGAILSRLLQIEPNSLRDRIRLGNLLLDQRQWSRALAQFSLARRIDPGSADGLLGFARAADHNGMPDRALEAAERGAKEFPKDPRFAALAAEIRARGPQPAR
jgi:tetratricopeptide (TPR) repeat protein